MTDNYSELASAINSIIALNFHGSVKNGLDPDRISDASYYEYGAQTEAIAPIEGADYEKDEGSVPHPTPIKTLAEREEEMPEDLVYVQEMLLHHSLQLIKGACVTLLQVGDMDEAQKLADTAVQTMEWFETTIHHFSDDLTVGDIEHSLSENVDDILNAVPQLRPEALDYLIEDPGQYQIMPMLKNHLRNELS